MRFATACLCVLLLSNAALAQVPAGVGEGWKGEFDLAADQLTRLAEATPADKFAWRPAPGVRSIAEVYMHIAITNHYLLTQATDYTFDFAKLGKDPEKSVTDKPNVIRLLKESFEAVRIAYAKADRQKKVQLFKKATTSDAVFLRLLIHNHEHMGQAVAYARMNGIVPPWSG